jgi:hypothetical protein
MTSPAAWNQPETRLVSAQMRRPFIFHNLKCQALLGFRYSCYPLLTTIYYLFWSIHTAERTNDNVAIRSDMMRTAR